MLATLDLENVRGRLASGEKLREVAEDIGISWQRLSKMLRGKIGGTDRPATPDREPDAIAADVASETPTAPAETPRQPLTERLRPKTLSEIAGQDPTVAMLKAFVAAPYPAAFIFAGDTGTGKTSAAVALAADLGCDVARGEYGGLHVVASGDQTADNVREAVNKLEFTTWSGSGWKVLIVNEADRMCRPAENIWLDRLESLPPRSVIVFTTNELERLTQRFMDRCRVLKFESRPDAVRPAALQFIKMIWHKEASRPLSDPMAATIFESCINGGHFSFRRAVSEIQDALVRKGRIN